MNWLDRLVFFTFAAVAIAVAVKVGLKLGEKP